jgi:hypothetical protein
MFLGAVKPVEDRSFRDTFFELAAAIDEVD